MALLRLSGYGSGMPNVDRAVALALTRRLVANGEARAIRELNHLSRADVATAVGASSTAVWRWERGDRVPRGLPALRYGELLAVLSGLVAE